MSRRKVRYGGCLCGTGAYCRKHLRYALQTYDGPAPLEVRTLRKPRSAQCGGGCRILRKGEDGV